MKYSKEFLLSELWALEAKDPVKRVTSPANIIPAVLQYAEKDQEHFIVINLDGEHKVISINVVSMGILNRTLVHPREIFRRAIVDNSACIMLCHNHPSGNLEPSIEDIEITNRIKSAGKIIGIEVLDHIILSKRGYYSFLEEGKI